MAYYKSVSTNASVISWKQELIVKSKNPGESSGQHEEKLLPPACTTLALWQSVDGKDQASISFQPCRRRLRCQIHQERKDCRCLRQITASATEETGSTDNTMDPCPVGGAGWEQSVWSQADGGRRVVQPVAEVLPCIYRRNGIRKSGIIGSGKMDRWDVRVVSLIL